MGGKNYMNQPRKVTEGSELSKSEQQAVRNSNALLKAATALALAGAGGVGVAMGRLGDAKKRRQDEAMKPGSGVKPIKPSN
jgi:hypothetical protein|tara:strand:+ start:190 stop:432 length:243 start_codon:yes stop_codon:yes gene_type:complete